MWLLLFTSCTWRLANTHFKPSEASDYFSRLYSFTSLDKTPLCSTDSRILRQLSPAFHQNASQILTGNVHLRVFSSATKHLESVLESSGTSARFSQKHVIPTRQQKRALRRMKLWKHGGVWLPLPSNVTLVWHVKSRNIQSPRHLALLLLLPAAVLLASLQPSGRRTSEKHLSQIVSQHHYFVTLSPSFFFKSLLGSF